MVADRDDNRRRLAAFFVPPVDVRAVVRIDEPDAEFVAAVHLVAIDAGVDPARFWIAHDPDAAGDVCAGVELVVRQQGELAKIHLIAGQHLLLDGCVPAQDFSSR